MTASVISHGVTTYDSGYELTVEKLLDGLSPETLEISNEIAAFPNAIRGFGVIKDKSIASAKIREEKLSTRFQKPSA